MIFYFSGTGNSRLAARVVAEKTGDELISINSLIKNNKHSIFVSDSPCVFVCPTYCWRVPPVVESFIRDNSFDGCKKAYFILTCGSDTGNAAHHAKALCSETGFEFMGLKGIVMPENYIAMFDVPDVDEAERIIALAMPEIEAAAETVKSGELFADKKPTLGGKICSSKPVHSVFFRYFVKAEGFYSTDKCVSCGKCADSCPFGNITLTDGEPVWGESCTHCMACIAGCPSEAIEYKRKSLGKPRHYIK